MRLLTLVLLVSTAHAAPIKCRAVGDLTAPVVRIDCEVIGDRAAYTLDAHAQAYLDVARFEAAARKLEEQRNECHAARVTERAFAAASLNSCADALGACKMALKDVAPPPSRMLWAGIGAALTLVAIVAADRVL